MVNGTRGDFRVVASRPSLNRDCSLVHRFTKTGTNEIDGLFRQARRESAAVLRYGKILQRSMAEKDAISCLGFSETVY